MALITTIGLPVILILVAWVTIRGYCCPWPSG